MRALAASAFVHAVLFALLALHSSRSRVPERGTAVASVAIAVVEPPIVVDVVDLAPGGDGRERGSSPAPVARPTRAAAPRKSPDAWQQVTVSMDSIAGQPSELGAGGSGSGQSGSGDGAGLGFGGVRIPDDIPAAPAPLPAAPVRVSQARPARLIYPTRERDVEDEADLFVAKVTVDRDGDVVGARMVKTRPGTRGDQAANAIWTFRYLPALDEDGRPIKSSFEQPFQIRR